MPADLRVLFVGESPPSRGTFFYDADSVLYRATREAFVSGLPGLRESQCFLEAFRGLGCYLDDLSLRPIDHLPEVERGEARDGAVGSLARRLEPLEPRVVVVVVKGIREQVAAALERAGLGAVACEALPFPGRWGRAEYIAELADLARRWHRSRVLRAP